MLLRRRRSRARRAVVAGAVLLLVGGLAALTTWQALAAATRSGVVVGADARPFLCRTGRLVVQGQEDDPQDPGDSYTTALEATRDLDCDLRFVVEDQGPLPIRVRSVAMPFLGPESGVPIRATALDGGFFLVGARSVGDGRDVRFTVPGAGMLLQPGDRAVLFARLRWKAGGCLDANATFTADLPAVTVSVLGTGGTATPRLPAWTFAGRDRPADCR